MRQCRCSALQRRGRPQRRCGSSRRGEGGGLPKIAFSGDMQWLE